jgi:hypothetical protein
MKIFWCLTFCLLASPHMSAGRSASVKITVKPSAICTGRDKVCQLLGKWYAAGTAAGNAGDFYDNRDGGHSQFNTGRFPQLDRITYTDQTLKTHGWALQRRLLEGVVFGNSSTSDAPTRSGSNPRHYYRSTEGLAFLYRQYRHNNLYAYPEHKDHDPGLNGQGGGYGDLYPTNTPYLIISQGSSGSDQPFLQAIAATLAAFRPEVKAKLIQAELLMPTFQMILRMSNQGVQDDQVYLSQRAHPTVFEGKQLDILKMIQMAQAIELGEIPPMIQLQVIEEKENTVGKDYFEPPQIVSEQLADTPAVIARIVRGPQYVRSMVVSAQQSFDVNNRDLTWHWVVLRGDREKIEILPQNDSQSVVELRVPYHPRRPISAGSSLLSNRADIGVFVHNGHYFSAPGFITFFTLANEGRTYNRAGQLLEIDYQAQSSAIDFAGVTDWSAFLQTFLDEQDSLGRRLLRQGLQPEELARVEELAAAYQPYGDQARAPADRYAKLKAKTGLLKQAVQAADSALQEAEERAAFLLESEQNQQKLEELRQRKQATAEDYEQVSKQLKESKVANDNSKAAAKKFLLETQFDAAQSVADRLLAVLNAIREDTQLYVDHANAIDQLLKVHPTERKQPSIPALIEELHATGVMSSTAQGVALVPLPADSPLKSERFTGFERSRLQQLHLEIMNQLIYPSFLHQQVPRNFCDLYLTTDKPWRDSYHYAPDGTCLGWTRHLAGQQVEIDADGNMILEMDKLGRTKRAQTTIYQGSRKDPRKRWKLDWLAGEETIEITYKSDQDYVGTTTKQGKLEGGAKRPK